MKIGITGGMGFIGSCLTRRFIADGHEVRIIDDMSTGRLQNLEDCHFELHKESITNLSAVRNFTVGLDIVFHLAALGSVPRSLSNPRSTLNANVIGSFNLLESLRELQTPAIFISSSSIYGNLYEGAKREDQVGVPLSPYAASKASMERFVESYRNAFNLNLLVFRLFNVFGPYQRFDHEYSAVIPKWINLAMQDKPIEIYGDGTITRDFTFVDEVTNVLSKSTEMVSMFNKMKVINLAFGRTISLNYVANLVCNYFPNVKIEHKPPKVSDIVNSTCSTEKLHKFFPDAKERLFDECFKETLFWIKENSENQST